MSKLIKTVVFDIETGALPDEQIKQIAPAFKESSVLTGNLGLEKSLEKIKAARERHLLSIIDKAALHAEYGEVLAIGIEAEGQTTILTGDEANILKQFWDRADADCRQGLISWVGFNILSFDLPFLFRRSLINGVSIPHGLQPVTRYWPTFFRDLMDTWKAGDWKALISLDRFCKACGQPGKSGDGKHFKELFEEDQDAAVAYLENDLKITRNLADWLLPLLS